LVIGSDLLRRLPEWKDFEQLKKEVKIVVAHRENYPIDKSSDFILANITQIDVSSSQIRDLIKQGRSIRYLVKGSIKDYIEKHNLYK
jgi:nicotinate-nucleotide adenylyltransferase